MNFFDETYYLQAKLKQLHAAGESYTEGTLQAAFKAAGLTPEEHYQAYGRGENLNPNPYFNESEYLYGKLNQLVSNGEKTADGQPYTITSLKAAIAAAGLTPAEHYEKFGSFETTADGHLINPSNAFDANAYFSAKLAQLQSPDNPNAGERVHWQGKSVSQLADVFNELGVNPVAHYSAYGAAEASTAKVAMVQTVPSEQRVPNDPVRTVLNENVPTNYNPASPPLAAAQPGSVTKPADVGQKVPVSVSPAPIIPKDAALVPGDAGYKAPPAGLVDTNEKPVVPPRSDTGGNWAVINPDGSADLITPDGKPGGTLPPGSLDPDNPDTPVVPDVKPTPKPDPSPGPDAPADVTFTATPDADGVLTVTTTSELKKAYTVAVDDSGKATVQGSSTVTLKESGVTGLDLSGVKTPADEQSYLLITDLSKAGTTVTKFVGANAVPGGANPPAVTSGGSDFVKITSEQAASGSFAFSKGFDAGTGDDIVRITDGISGDFVAGALIGVETLIAAYTVASGTTTTINLAAALPTAGDDLTLYLTSGTAGTAKSGGNITLRGASQNDGSGYELGLIDLNIAKVSMAVESINKYAALDLHNSKVGELDLATGTTDTTLQLNLSGSNDVKVAANANLTVVEIEKIESFSGGDFSLTATDGTSTVDFSNQVAGTNMKITVLEGYTGSLKITGGAGNDTITGGTGMEASATNASGSTFIGGAGADQIRGTAGNDIIYGNSDTVFTDSVGSGANPNAGRYGSGSGSIVDAKNGAFITAITASGDFVNMYNGWLGNDTMHATNAKDVFEYHTHAKETANSPAQAFAASTFKELGTDTIKGFTIGSDMLFVNMIELATGGPGGHGITAAQSGQTGTYADILIKANIGNAAAAAAGTVNYKIEALSAGAVTALGVTGDSSTINDYKVTFYIGAADTLTINFVDLVGTLNTPADLLLA